MCLTWKILSCRTVCVEEGSVLWESWLCSKELQHMQQQNYCVTVIQNVHVSQQMVHWLFWVTFYVVFLSPWGKYLETDHGITSSSFCHISFYEKYYLVFVRSKKLCLTVMGDESIQSRLLQHIHTCFAISITAGCIFQTAFFWVFQHVLRYILFRFCTKSLLSPFLAMLEACFGLRFWDHQQLWHCIVFNFFHIKSFNFQDFLKFIEKRKS